MAASTYTPVLSVFALSAILLLTGCHHRHLEPSRASVADRSRSNSSAALTIRSISVLSERGEHTRTLLHNNDTVSVPSLPPLQLTAETTPDARRVFFRVRRASGSHGILFDRAAPVTGDGNTTAATIPAELPEGSVTVTAIPFDSRGARGKPLTLRLNVRQASAVASTSTSHVALRHAFGFKEQSHSQADSAQTSSDGNKMCKAEEPPTLPRHAPTSTTAPPVEVAPSDTPECRALQGAKGKLMIVCSHPFDHARRAYAFRSDTKAHVCDFLNVMSPSVAMCEASDELVDAIKQSHVAVAFEEGSDELAGTPHVVPIRVR